MGKKVCFISNMSVAPWGGSEDLWSQAALRLRKQGFQVATNTLGWPTKAEQILELERAGCEMSFRSQPTRWNRIYGRFLPEQGVQWLRRQRCDLVVINQGANFGCTRWAHACTEQKLKYVMIAQAAGETIWPPAHVLADERAAYAGAANAFFVSKHNLRLTELQLAKKLDHAKVVFNPCSTASLAPLPWPEGEGLRLACVGRLDPAVKGQDLIIETLDRPDWRQRDLRVTFYGSGAYRTYLEESCRMRGLDSICFGGFAKPAAVWTDHHALLLPSRLEGLPLVMVEAMYFGRPCIVTNVGGNAEVLRDGVTGYLVPFPSTSSLSHVLERVWNHRSQLRTMGQAALDSIRSIVPTDPVGDFVEELTKLI